MNIMVLIKELFFLEDSFLLKHKNCSHTYIFQVRHGHWTKNYDIFKQKNLQQDQSKKIRIVNIRVYNILKFFC